jgi:hypothetical protein
MTVSTVVLGLLSSILTIIGGVLSGWVGRPKAAKVGHVVLALAVVAIASTVINVIAGNAGPRKNGQATGRSTNSPSAARNAGHKKSKSHAAAPSSHTSSVPKPQVVAPPPKEPKYLADMGSVDLSGNVTAETGDPTLRGREYPDSVWLCFDLENLATAGCDDNTRPAWADYEVPAGYGTFRATVGFSGSSHSGCHGGAQIIDVVSKQSLFTHDFYIESAVPVTLKISGKSRLRLEVKPKEGTTCHMVFGSARYEG